MDVFELAAKLSLDTTEYENSLDEAGKTAEDKGKDIKNGLNKAANVATGAMVAGGAAMVAFGKEAVQVGMNFDSAMSQVAATMGFTVEDLNDETSEAAQTLQTLRLFAMDMGATTTFSATQAAEALNYMALAGYDADKSMKMLPTVLNLAAAGSMDLALASDMVTDAQTALGLDIEQTAAMVDMMAAAASSSNTSVTQLGTAFLAIGGTAKIMAGGTNELSTMLGIMADNGIKGAEAGIHLRNILLSLTPQSENAAIAMENIGMDAYDAEGNMRPLKDIIVDMQDALAGLTDEEKTNTLSMIFNKTDLKAINALLGTSADRFDELSGLIGDSSGAAEEMAGVQLDNLEGDITLLKSAFEGLQIQLSDKLTPAIRDAMPAITDLVGNLSEKIAEADFSGITTVITGLAEGIVNFATYCIEHKDTIVNTLEAIATGLIAWKGITVVSDIVGQVSQLYSWLGMLGGVLGVSGAGLAAIGGGAALAAVGVAELVGYARELDGIGYLGDGHELQEYADNVDAVSLKLQQAQENFDNLSLYGGDLTMAQEEMDRYTIALRHAQEEYEAMQQGFAMLEQSAEETTEAIEGQNEATQNVEKVGTTANKAGTAVEDSSSRMVESFQSVADSVQNDLVGGMTEMGTAAADETKDMQDVLSKNMAILSSNMKVWGQDLIISLSNGIILGHNQNLLPAIDEVTTTIADNLEHSEPKKGPLSDDSTWMPDMMQSFAAGIRENTPLVRDAVTDAFDFSNEVPKMTARVEGTERFSEKDDQKVDTIIALLQRIISNGLNANINKSQMYRTVTEENQKRTKAIKYNSLAMA